MTTPILELKNIHQVFHQGDESLHILKGVNLTINKGECVALLGPSGSGKTTLLQIAGLLEKPSDGAVYMAGENATLYSDAQRTTLRRSFAGFVYQFHHLLPEFSAVENVTLPQLIAEESKKEAYKRASLLLESLGLGHRLHHRPKKLSGGEQQRVAIARALANAPKLLLADEPTGNLDPETSDVVFSQLLTLCRQQQLAAFIATHNMDLAKKMDRIVVMNQGIL